MPPRLFLFGSRLEDLRAREPRFGEPAESAEGSTARGAQLYAAALRRQQRQEERRRLQSLEEEQWIKETPAGAERGREGERRGERGREGEKERGAGVVMSVLCCVFCFGCRKARNKYINKCLCAVGLILFYGLYFKGN